MNQNTPPAFNPQTPPPPPGGPNKSNSTARTIATAAAIVGGVGLVGGGAVYAAQHFGRTPDEPIETDVENTAEDQATTDDVQVTDDKPEVVHHHHHHYTPRVPRIIVERPVVVENEFVHYTNGGIPVVDVDDSLAFDDAFRVGRILTGDGPGGIFLWRGGYYGTYYDSEWNALTPGEKMGYYEFVDNEMQNDQWVQASLGQDNFAAIQNNLGNEVVVGDDGSLLVLKGGITTDEVGGPGTEGVIDGNQGVEVVVEGGEVIIDGPGSENISGVEPVIENIDNPPVEGEIIVDGSELVDNGEVVVEGGEVVVDGGDIIIDDPGIDYTQDAPIDPAIETQSSGDDYASTFDNEPAADYSEPSVDYSEPANDYSEPSADLGGSDLAMGDDIMVDGI